MDIGFLSDNLCELHKGNTCFIYIKEQIEEIEKALLDKYGEKINVKEADGYWELRPIKQLEKLKKMKPLKSNINA